MLSCSTCFALQSRPARTRDSAGRLLCSLAQPTGLRFPTQSRGVFILISFLRLCHLLAVPSASLPLLWRHVHTHLLNLSSVLGRGSHTLPPHPYPQPVIPLPSAQNALFSSVWEHSGCFVYLSRLSSPPVQQLLGNWRVCPIHLFISTTKE